MLLNREDSLLVLVDVQTKLTPAVLNANLLVARCQWLLKLAQKMGVPILVTEQYPKGLGKTIEQLQAYFTQEESIDKITFSCMGEPKFLNQVISLQKKQLILIGIETHVCILQTALDLKNKGYDVFVVADAVSCRGELNMKYGLKRMKQEGVRLITSEMVFFEWLRTAGTKEFKELSQEFFQGEKE